MTDTLDLKAILERAEKALADPYTPSHARLVLFGIPALVREVEGLREENEKRGLQLLELARYASHRLPCRGIGLGCSCGLDAAINPSRVSSP